MPIACNCAACHLRRLTTPLVLIAVGGLLLAHMLRPGFDNAAMVGGFLVFLGLLQLLRHAAPRAAAVPHPPRGSFFVPLLLIAIGVLILVRHILPQYPLGAWIAHYWPVLLILWGLTRLVEHYTLPPRTRSGMSGGEILLVVLIVVFGLAFSGAYRFGHSRLANYWGVNVEGWNPFLQTYNFTAAAQAPLPAANAPGAAPLTVLVRGYRGDVTLVPGPPGAISAALDDTIHADGHDAAQNLFAASQPLIRREGDQFVVLPAGDGTRASVEADLKLTLPPTLAVVIQLENGDVAVSDWRAGLEIHTAHGSVTAGRIAGNVTVSSGHDSVSLDQITGNVSVTGGGDDVGISNVTGDVTLEGEFVGSLDFRALARGIRFNSSRTALEIAALPGGVAYDMGRISIHDARAVTLRTRDEEIEIQGFTGPLQVQNRNDSVTLATSEPPSAPIAVTDRDADITLTLPPASRFTLQATAQNGEVHNEFEGAEGAAIISLETTNGTVAVRKGNQ